MGHKTHKLEPDGRTLCGRGFHGNRDPKRVTCTLCRRRLVDAGRMLEPPPLDPGITEEGWRQDRKGGVYEAFGPGWEAEICRWPVANRYRWRALFRDKWGNAIRGSALTKTIKRAKEEVLLFVKFADSLRRGRQ